MKKKALILGWGISGKAAAQFLLERGFFIEVFDDRIKDWNEPSFVWFPYPLKKDLSHFSLFVPSPGVARDHPLYLEAKEQKIEIAGEAELALREVSQPAVAVTGSNGKTTVVKIIEHVLQSAKIPAKAVGNVGYPLTKQLLERKMEEVLILDLTSFQLETLRSQRIDFGIILNITENHLDRYESMEEYAKTKIHLENCLKKEGKIFVSHGLFSSFSHLFHREVNIFNDGEIEEIFSEELKKRFSAHDRENAAAAWKVVKHFGVDLSKFFQSLKTFSKPPHRIEFVEEIEGAFYFNDSKGTSVDAVIKAINAMNGPVILIAGGVDKKLSFLNWKIFQDKIKMILVIGQTKEKIYEELKDFFHIEKMNGLSDAIFRAKEIAKPGDFVLLSPGCSSYDMFRDYEHRGDEFKRLVHYLKDRKEGVTQ